MTLDTALLAVGSFFTATVAVIGVIETIFKRYDAAKRMVKIVSMAFVRTNLILLKIIVKTSGSFMTWVMKLLGFGDFLLNWPDGDPSPDGRKRRVRPFKVRMDFGNSAPASPFVRAFS